jgi:hypothetical protein
MNPVYIGPNSLVYSNTGLCTRASLRLSIYTFMNRFRKVIMGA